MVVRITFDALKGINVGRWLVYEATGGEVVRTVNTRVGMGSDTTIIFQIEPPVLLQTFLTRFPEAIEVIEIMADASLSNPDASPIPNNTTFTVRVVTITTAGTPQQLPAITVPNGRALVIASNVGNAQNRRIFVANSSVNALDPTMRTTLSPGNSVRLFVDNADDVWVDSNVSGSLVDVIVEQ